MEKKTGPRSRGSRVINEKELDQYALEIAKKDYSFYLEFVHNGAFKLAKHHNLICQHLEAIDRGELDKLMIFLPPRHSKSSTVSENFPSWYLGRDPRRKVILVSYGDSLAKKFGRSNRQRIETYGKEIFNMELARDNSSVQHFSIEGQEGYMLSQGYGSSITGFGCNLLIIDDPIKSRAEANSLTYRDRLWDEYQATLLTRLERKGNSAQILIQTRWHEDDLSGRLLNDKDGKNWTIIKLPAEAEENDPLGRELGDPLWPEMGYNKQWIEETKRAVGSMTWASLYQQRPTAQEGGLIKRKWFQFYRQAPSNLDEIIISVDTTFKDTKWTDYCVMQVWGRKGSNKYFLDQVRDRMDLPATIQALRSLSHKWPTAQSKLIEDKANGSAVISMLKNEISGLIPVNPTESKISRAYSVTPDIEAGNVFLPENAPFISDFMAEVQAFPNSAHDDQVDAMVQALARFKQYNGLFIGRA
jgi:predicted phage terminase large subunit-like protein